jgi:hypothetical protein
MSDAVPNDSALLQTIAESSPNELLLRRRFWFAQRRFLLLCLASSVAFLLLAPYTYQDVKEFVFLTILIHSLALWSAFLTVKSIAKLEVESAILSVIERKASALLRALKAKQVLAFELDTLEVRILPDNSSTPAPAMIRLFQHICKEARDRKFESSVSVLQSYREEPLEDVFKLQNLQKIALWLGILGTFIGLMLAIREGNLSNLQSMDNFSEVVRNMFDDLFISFSASLAGLEVAVILGFFLLLLRKRQEAYFKLMESSVTTMLSLARNALNRDDVQAEFSQVSMAMTQLNDTLAVQTSVLSNRLDALQKQIITQNEQIHVGLEKLKTTGQQFDGFLNHLSDTQKQFLTDIGIVYDAVSLTRLGTTLQESIVQAGRHISGVITPNVVLVSSELAKFNDSIASLNGSLAGQAQQVSGKIDSLENQVKEQAARNVSSAKDIKNQLVEGFRRAAAPAPQQLSKSDVEELGRNVSLLNRKLANAALFQTPEPGLPARLFERARAFVEGLYESASLALRRFGSGK